MDPVNSRPIFPQASPSTFNGLLQSFGMLIRTITTTLIEYATRINACMPKDGTEPATAPFPLLSIVADDLTDYAAVDYEGCLLYVSDASAGAKLKYSDGTNWIDAA